jgi:hypothetical protein
MAEKLKAAISVIGIDTGKNRGNGAAAQNLV